MAYKKKTRFRKPGRAGGMTILKAHPEKDGRGKNIYFSAIGRKGYEAQQAKYTRTVIGTSKYALQDKETGELVAIW